MIEPLNLPSLDANVDPTRWDRFGVGLSALCTVHCLGLPAVAVLAPALALPDSHAFHVGLLALVAPIALVALATGFRRHRTRTPITLGALGLAFLIVALAPGLPGLGEKSLTIVGGLLLVAAHAINSRLATCDHTGETGRRPRHSSHLGDLTVD